MRIAVVRRKYTPHGGGAERYAARVVRELCRRGHRVTVFAHTFTGEEDDACEWRRVPCRLFSLSTTTAFHHAVQKVLDRDAYDVVFSLCRTYPSDVCRVTEQIHTEWLSLGYGPLARLNPRHQAIVRLEREVYSPNNTGMLITNSELVKRQISSRFGFPPERIFPIRNGVDPKTFFAPESSEQARARTELGLPRDAFVVLFVAENFRIKGLRYAIQAIAGLDDSVRRGLRLAVVGSDSPRRYRQQAERLGCAGQVAFLGRRRDMRSCYIAADVLVHPTLYEPFANVCLEAMACGIPVITTAMNGAAELVEPGGNGFVVPEAADAARIRQHLADLADSPVQRRSSMGEAALAVARECTWESHVERLVQLLPGSTTA